MKNALIRVTLLAAVCFTLIAPQALAGSRVVNCDDGGSLQKAIDSGAGSAKPIDIQLTGTCYENVTISRDLVSINGDGLTTIYGQVRLFGAAQIVFRNLTITGPGFGIRAANSRVRLLGVGIIGNDDSGIFATESSSVRLSNSVISGNHGPYGVHLDYSSANLVDTEVSGNESDGIGVFHNASLLTQGGSITGNNSLGIFVRMNSTANLDRTHVSGNGAYGLLLDMASAGEFREVHLNENAVHGFELSGNSVLNFTGGMIGRNGEHGGWVLDHSVLRLFDTQVNDNIGHGIIIGRDGGVTVVGNTEISNNTEYFQVLCQGKEASIEIDPSANVYPIECPDPDF